MEARKLVSIVIPAFNASETIEDAIASAGAQTHRDIEIIVVDDGSNDDTADVARRLTATDPRLRVIVQPNGGAAAARNTGIAAAQGDFVAFLDADDFWHPRKIERQLDRFAGCGPSVGLVYTWSTYTDAGGRILPGRAFAARFEGDVYAQLLISNFVNGTHMVRAEAIRAVGGYDTRLKGNEDLEFYLRLAERYDFAMVPECLAAYRTHPDSLSHRVWAMRRHHAAVRQEARRRHPELPDWLLRWSAGNQLWFLAFRALRAGDWISGTLLAAETVLKDPAFVTRKPIRSLPRRALARLLYQRPMAPEGIDPFPVEGEPPPLAPREILDPIEIWRQRRVSGVGIRRPRTDRQVPDDLAGSLTG